MKTTVKQRDKIQMKTKKNEANKTRKAIAMQENAAAK